MKQKHKYIHYNTHIKRRQFSVERRQSKGYGFPLGELRRGTTFNK